MSQEKAIVQVTTIDNLNTYTSNGYCSTDLPDDAVGEIVGDAIRKAWRSGCDPVKDGLTVVIRFNTGQEKDNAA